MTVLVLGAGTSLNYGYPSGIQLVDKIVERLQFSDDSSELYRDLVNNKPYSIDSFLNKFPHHDAVAKALIAEILFECENPDIRVSERDDFYRFLFHSIPEEKYENFKIITFNYDRSLEYYFSRALLPSKGSEERAFEALSRLDIIHIHGRLPSLPSEKKYEISTEREQYPYGFGARGYVPTDRYGNRIPVAFYHEHDVLQRKGRVKNHGQRQFKTVYQNHETHGKAKEIMESASRIFFLGFGYHELNLRVLGLDWTTPRGKRIFGTAYGMNNVRKAEVKRLAPIIQLLNCDNMSLFSDYHSLANPELVVTT